MKITNLHKFIYLISILICIFIFLTPINYETLCNSKINLINEICIVDYKTSTMYKIKYINPFENKFNEIKSVNYTTNSLLEYTKEDKFILLIDCLIYLMKILGIFSILYMFLFSHLKDNIECSDININKLITKITFFLVDFILVVVCAFILILWGLSLWH